MVVSVDGVRIFLVVLGVLFLGFVVPLLMDPLRWARTFRWEIPEPRGLVLYLGRCLGAVGLALVVGCFVAATDPKRHALILLLMAIAGGMLTVVHIRGALARDQPWTETAEIPLFAGLTLVLGWIYLTLA